MGIDGREFYEKSFGFFHEGKFYRFTSSVPNSDGEPEHEGDMTKRPVLNKSTVRGETLIGMAIIERDEKGKLHMQSLTQLDFKLALPGFI